MTNTKRQLKTVKQWSLKIAKAHGTNEETRYPENFVMTKIINNAERESLS